MSQPGMNAPDAPGSDTPQKAAEAVSAIQEIINREMGNKPAHGYQLYETEGRPEEKDGLLLLVIGKPEIKISPGARNVCSGLLYFPTDGPGSTRDERFSHLYSCVTNMLPKLTRRTICVDRMYRELPEGVALYIGAKHVSMEGPFHAAVQIRIDPSPTEPPKKGVVAVDMEFWEEGSKQSFTTSAVFKPAARVALED